MARDNGSHCARWPLICAHSNACARSIVALLTTSDAAAVQELDSQRDTFNQLTSSARASVQWFVQVIRLPLIVAAATVQPLPPPQQLALSHCCDSHSSAYFDSFDAFAFARQNLTKIRVRCRHVHVTLAHAQRSSHAHKNGHSMSKLAVRAVSLQSLQPR